MKISIIIPVYNAEEYLEECLNSIANQSYENIEIIIVDDGSTDGSKAIYDNFAKNDKRFKVLFQQNSGVASARNLAIKRVKGRYIAFVDADDYVHKDYILFMKNLSDEHNSDIVQVNYDRSNDFDIEKFGLIKEDVVSCTKNELHLAVCGGGNSNLHSKLWCKLFKTRVFKDVVFPTGLIYEDEAVMHKLFDNAKKFISNQTVLYYHRNTKNGIMNKRLSTKNLDIIYVLNLRKIFYKNKGLKSFYYLSAQRTSVAIIELYRKFENSNALTSDISDILYNEFINNFVELKSDPSINENILTMHKIWLEDLLQK
ncbi:MAG: glycosyltransferase family 2 protein [Clostridia bacterium]